MPTTSGWKWSKLRQRKILRDPICEKCKRSIGHEVDHKKQRSTHPHLIYDWDNLQTICSDCHGTKTADETAERNKRLARERRLLSRPLPDGTIPGGRR